MTELSRCIVFFKAVKDHHFRVCLADFPCFWSAPKIPPNRLTSPQIRVVASLPPAPHDAPAERDELYTC